jgi:c-di-GMP-related signal transduction protein
MKQNVDGLIRSFIQQLSRTDIHETVRKLYEPHKATKDQPAEFELKETLQQLIHDLPRLFLVIDALDECTEREELLEFISELRDWTSKSHHVVFTSREEQDLRDGLSVLDPTHLRINEASVRKDISVYIEKRLTRHIRLRNWCRRPQVKQAIETALLGGAQGM